MIGSGDNSGTISLLIGVVLVVFVGIGISLVADSRLSFGNTQSTINESIKSDRQKIENLTFSVDHLQNSWTRDHAPNIGQEQQISDLSGQTSRNRNRLAELRADKAGLEKSIIRIAQQNLDYRVHYKNQARADSVGESLDSITLTDGRSFRSVVIRGFDTSGLRIHHKGGSARIRYSDLPRAWKERFQWHPDEAKVRKPKPPAEVASEGPETQIEAEDSETNGQHDEPAVSKKAHEAKDAEKVAEARSHYLIARKSYLDARNQASIARGHAYASNKSVPGSLETWAERAERMDRISRQRHAGYIKARSALSSVSPGDPLLRQKIP
ncbi:hypothetical protein [Haloferula sp.]|uniref:hypothetical protein n=1 Tax=Haloferula sp. TaxID=2497595 RepID=UPI00329AD5FF